MSQEEIINKIDQLILNARLVLSTRISREDYAEIDSQQFKQWRINCFSFIEKNFGRESIYFQQFSTVVEDDNLAAYCEDGIAILVSLKREIETGS